MFETSQSSTNPPRFISPSDVSHTHSTQNHAQRHTGYPGNELYERSSRDAAWTQLSSTSPATFPDYRSAPGLPSHSYDHNSPELHSNPDSRQHPPITLAPHRITAEMPLSIDTRRSLPIQAEINSAITVPASEPSGDEQGGSESKSGHPNPRTRRTRREKPRIELAPDQPPTTQGKPRARVYVACLQCRTRKIRCDGAKPICHNCGRRGSGGSECNYDPIPKRRGPDRTPGARQRMVRDVRNEIENGVLSIRRRRRRSSADLEPQVTSVELGSHPDKSASPVDPTPPTVKDTTFVSPPHPLVQSQISPHYVESSCKQCLCHASYYCPDLARSKGIDQEIKYTAVNQSSYADAYHPTYHTHPNIQNKDEEWSPETSISPVPSLVFSRRIWWDSLLSLYLFPTSNSGQFLSVSQRQTAAQAITADLRFLFRASNYWFSFFHVPTFFGTFFDPSKRERIQPSLVLALLAMSTFWQSSEIGLGAEGRERALRFRDEAQGAMEASFNSGWIDETLAQAAWLLALFEVCAHPYHSTERSTSALVMLDSIIRTLSLTLLDADDPSATVFSRGTVPIVSKIPASNDPVYDPWSDSTAHQHENQSLASMLPQDTNLAVESVDSGCTCTTMTLGTNWPATHDHAPMWSSTPAWNGSWTEAEIRRESCRRLCWSSTIMAAGHISYTTATTGRSQVIDLFIADPANYALLFSGEYVARSPNLRSSRSSKDTIWALHDRAFLLWHGCIRMRNDRFASDSEKAQFAVKAWIEADALEASLNRHNCGIEKAFIYHGREYIFNTRMCISYEFQRYVPLPSASVNGLFHRGKAEEWLTHQTNVATRFVHAMPTITGNANNILARRPFFVFWFMGQISRALLLWRCDRTLLVALDVCKAFLPAIDYLTNLWPCAEQRHRYEILWEHLAQACQEAGVAPPPLLSFAASPLAVPIALAT